MENDVNNAQVVTEEGVNSGQVADDQGVTESTTQNAEETAQNQEQAVPYDRFKEVNEQKKLAEEQVMQAQRDNDILRGQMQGMTQQAQPVQPKSTYEQAMADCGVTVDDLYDGNNMVKVQNRKSELDAQNMQLQQNVMADRQFMMSHPDYNEVVGSVNPTTGQLMTASRELQDLLSKKPYLAGACTSAQGAYEIVIRERQIAKLQETQQASQEHLNRQNVDNATQPMGASAAGGGTTSASIQGGMMSREKVEEIEQKLARGERI